MSRPAHPIIQLEVTGDERIDTTGNPNVPRSEQRQPPQGQPTLSDGAEPIFNMYVKMSQEEDNKMADRWQKDADGILIFAGLFSAAVAALLAVSIQDLRPNPQDTSAFYLANIYQLLADPNISRASILATPATPPPFSPPRYAIWVNSLWFLSLVISLTSALLATLLQQWARRHLTVTQPPRLSPHKRARIRSFFADGVENFHLPLAVETLPTLLHVSLFLFFSGLLVFLFNINHTTFSIVAWWVGLSGGIYGCIALLPIFRHDSPYYSPLSFSAWFLLNGVLYEVFRILTFVTLFLDCFTATTYIRFHRMMEAYHKRTSWGIVKTAQERASNMSAEIDCHVLKWTFDALDEDHELEQFFEAIPAFSTSQVVHEPKRMLAKLNVWVLAAAWDGLLIRTFSSRLLSEMMKERRFILCMQAIDALDSSFPSPNFLSQVFGPPSMDGVLQSVQMGHLVRSRRHRSKGSNALYAQALVVAIIASVRERDDRWKLLVKDQLRISEDVLQDYLAHGDSVLLANWIHFFPFYHKHLWDSVALEKIQPIISKFDIRNTLPGLQNDFCALWNHFTRKAHKHGYRHITYAVLRPNLHLFIALHQGTDAVPTAFGASPDHSGPNLQQPSSYPLCNIPGHHPDGVTDETTHSPIHSRLVHLVDADANDDDDLDLNHLDPLQHLTYHPYPIIQSSHPPVNVGNYDFANTSSDPALTIETESQPDVPVNSPMANSESDIQPAMVASTAISPLLPSGSSGVNTDLQVVPPSMIPDIPSSSSPVPVSNDTLPDPLISSESASPTSQIDLITPSSGLLPQGPVPETSFTPPQVTSDSRSNLPETDATFDIHDNSRTPGLYDMAVILQQPHEPATPALDVVTDHSRHPADIAPPRDADRSP